MSDLLPTCAALTDAEARAYQARIVQTVRNRTLKNRGEEFTDAQIWQAIMDSKDRGKNLWDAAAAQLLMHVLEGRIPPSSPTY